MGFKVAHVNSETKSVIYDKDLNCLGQSLEKIKNHLKELELRFFNINISDKKILMAFKK